MVSSQVAKLVEAAGGEVDHSQPYAELWYDAHSCSSFNQALGPGLAYLVLVVDTCSYILPASRWHTCPAPTLYTLQLSGLV